MTLRSPLARVAAGLVTALGVAIGMTVAAVTAGAPAVKSAPVQGSGAADTVRAQAAQQGDDDDVVPEGGAAPSQPAAPRTVPAPAPAPPAPNLAPPPAAPEQNVAPPPAAPAVEAAPPPAGPALDGAPPPAADAAPPPVRKPGSAPVDGAPSAATAEAVGALPTMRVGESSVMVVTLRYLLRYHGAHLEAEADFSPETEAAVRDFQRLYGLPVDGVVGRQTWLALFVPVQLGEENEAVSAVQHRLGYDGFLEGDVRWGVFDAATDGAVRAYQQANGLPADGVVGPATWAKLVEHD